VTAIDNAKAKIKAALAAYEAACPAPRSPEAETVLERLSKLSESTTIDNKPTIFAFERILDLWPEPRPFDPNDPFIAELIADSEAYWGRSERPDTSEPRTLVGVLVEGASFAARLEDELAREEKALRTTFKATRALKVLRGFVRAIDRERKSPWTNTPLDAFDITLPGEREIERVNQGFHILEQLIEARAALASRSRVIERFGVSREAVFLGPIKEGARLAAKRIRATAPKPTLKEIAAVLNCAFETTAIDEVVLKELTGWKRRRG
jgi:hypothetical protein